MAIFDLIIHLTVHQPALLICLRLNWYTGFFYNFTPSKHDSLRIDVSDHAAVNLIVISIARKMVTAEFYMNISNVYDITRKLN